MHNINAQTHTVNVDEKILVNNLFNNCDEC